MKYRVRLAGRGTLRLGKTRTLQAIDHIVRISDGMGTSESGQPHHEGVRYTVEVEANNILEAIALAQNLASSTTDLLTFVGAAAIEDPIPLFAIDMESLIHDREFAQVIHDAPQLRLFRRALDEADFSMLFKALDISRSGNLRAYRRIDRALHYLRQSALETDAVDKFEDLWVGLESINPLIREKFAVGTSYRPTCKHCGDQLACAKCATQVESPDNASGIDHIVENLLSLPTSDAKLLRAKRIQIAHSTKSFRELFVNLASATEIARRALIAGIHNLLQLPAEMLPVLGREPLSLVGNASITVVATLVDLPLSQLESADHYPQLKLEALELVLPTDPNADPNLPHPPTPDTDPLNVLAVQVVVSPVNFAGEVKNARAYARFASDPEQTNSTFETIALPLKAS